LLLLLLLVSVGKVVLTEEGRAHCVISSQHSVSCAKHSALQLSACSELPAQWHDPPSKQSEQLVFEAQSLASSDEEVEVELPVLPAVTDEGKRLT